LNVDDYTIFFEMVADGSFDLQPTSGAEATSIELDELAELSRLVLEINEPTPKVYVTTSF
jgi:hypothetical protein